MNVVNRIRNPKKRWKNKNLAQEFLLRQVCLILLYPLLLYPDNLTTGHLFQFGRGHFKNRIRRPGRGPDFRVLQQILVEVSFQWLIVPDWWHTTDDETGRGADELRVRMPNGFTRVLADEILIHTVGAAGKDENRFTGSMAAKDERLDYLSDLAANASCGLGGGTRTFQKFDYLAIKPQELQSLLDF